MEQIQVIKAEIERRIKENRVACISDFTDLLFFIESLEKEQPKEKIIEVPKWFLKNVENTLRIQNNINLDKKTGETCQDRNVKESLNGLRKLLSGEELTGMERLEKLHPELSQEQPQGLDEAAEEYAWQNTWLDEPNTPTVNEHLCSVESFEAGAKWMAEQGMSINATIKEYRDVSIMDWSDDINISAIIRDRFKGGDRVIVQIRKKEE